MPSYRARLDEAWQKKEMVVIKQVAHNLKTTVSVMGLNVQLQPYLDALEYESLSDENFKRQMTPLTEICNGSMEEARQFYNTF